MKNNLKKILSLVLVAVMCLSLVPFSVFADAASKDGVACQYCQGTNTKWKSYQEATCSIHWSGDNYECQDCKAWTIDSDKGCAEGKDKLGLFTVVDADAPAHVADLELVKEGYDKTCTKDGLADKFLCKNCNEYVGGEVIPKSHDWATIKGVAPAADGWCAIVAPICGVRGGEYERSCPTCGLYEEKTTAKVDHVWDWDNPTNKNKSDNNIPGVDCNEDNEQGYIKFPCKNEGCTEVLEVKSNDCDHTWSEWATMVKPTCEAAGKETRKCMGCGATEDREEAKLDHTFAAGTAVAAVPGTCTKAGTVAYDTCTVCNNKVDTAGNIITDITDHLLMPDGTESADDFAHTWGTITYVDATCGEHAYKVWVCTNPLCNKVYKIVDETVEVQAHVGTLTYVPATVTCYADGNVAHYNCSACNKNFSDEAGLNALATIASKALAHKNAYVVDRVEATCKDEGTKQHVYCPDCDQKYYDKSCEEVYPAADLVIAKPQGHTGEAKWYKAGLDTDGNAIWIETTIAAEKEDAICTALTLYKLCSCCSYEYETTEIKDTINGHNYNTKAGLKSAENCVTGVYAWYYWTCEHCGGQTAKQETEFAHDFENSTIYNDDIAENCLGKTIRTYKCALDGCTATKPVEMGIGAHDVEFVGAKAATCTADGHVAYYLCKLCNVKFADVTLTTKIETNEALVGAYTKEAHLAARTTTVIKHLDPAYCTEYGYDVWECDQCGHVEADAISVKGHTQQFREWEDATCETDGFKEFINCKGAAKRGGGKCWVMIFPKVVLKATGHQNAAGETISHDCTDAVNAAITDRVCVNANCDDADKVIELSHNLVATSGVGNCVEDKYTADQCSLCYKLFNQSVEAGTKNPNNHKAADAAHALTIKEDNTKCQTAGTIVYTCGWCKGDIVENTVAQNVNHTSITHGTGTNLKVLPIDDMTPEQEALALQYFTKKVVPMQATSEGYTLYTCKWCDWSKKVDIEDPYYIWFSFDYNSANKNATESKVVNGGMVEVKIYAEALDKVATNIQATFNYDPNVLTFVGAEGADIFDQAIITGKNGLVTIYAFNDDITNSTINGKMLLATLTFKVATLDGEDELGVNADKKYLTTDFTNFAADATVANPGVDNEGRELECLLEDHRVKVNKDSIEIWKLGAISSDNWITGLDHVALFKLIASKGIEDGKLVAEADLDMDGDVDVDDYIFLAQYLGNELSYGELVEIVTRPAVEA